MLYLYIYIYVGRCSKAGPALYGISVKPEYYCCYYYFLCYEYSTAFVCYYFEYSYYYYHYFPGLRGDTFFHIHCSWYMQSRLMFIIIMIVTTVVIISCMINAIKYHHCYCHDTLDNVMFIIRSNPRTRQPPIRSVFIISNREISN